ncbi:MAG: ABC transporter permease [bacterium]|nr:ABC transporter permease [bacterium]
MATRQGRDHELSDEEMRRLLKESKGIKGESLWNDAWRRLRKNRASFWSLVFLALFGLTSFLVPLLPLPSPKALTLQIEPAPPDWPWGPERTYEDESYEPGARPSVEKGSFANNGWRHRATLEFTAPAASAEAIVALVEALTNRSAAYEAREVSGEYSHFLTVPLHRDDVPRVDYSPTGVEGTLTAWRVEAEEGDEVHYDLKVATELGTVTRWSVEQRTRRGKLYVSAEKDGATRSYQYEYTLGRNIAGKPRMLTLNGTLLPIDDDSVPRSRRKHDLQTVETRERISEPHTDLEARVRTALGTSDLGAATLAGVQIENGYWDLGALDEGLVHLRGRLFGSWQTGNWLGTDPKGQDLMARILWGSRTSILVALAATLCSLVIGVLYGAFSGLKGGRIDNLMMRVVDILYSVPFIFVVIFLITVVNEYRTELEDVYGIDREVIFFVVIGAIYWLTMARVVRGQVLSLKNSEFIEAARVIGASTSRILLSHIVPNVLSIVIVYLTLTIPAIMLFEAFLSFLGLGIEPPKVSWGTLAVESIEAVNRVHVYWWLVLFPALAMGSTLLALNVLGDGLRDALDPRLRGKD